MSDSLPANLPDIFPPEIAQVTAPLLFGITIAWALYGMLVVQVFIYHTCFKDRALFQFFVYSVFFLDTLQTCLMGADLFFWFGTGYGNIGHIANVHFAFFDTPMLSSLMALIIHSFFCYRIWVLSRSVVAPVLIIVLSIISLVGSWISAIEGHLAGNPALVSTHHNRSPIFLWLTGSAIADTFIAAMMTYLLTRAKGIHQRTNAIVQRLVILTMETNGLSAVLALLTLILYLAQADSTYFVTPTYLIGKIYSNSLLVILNNRFFLANPKQNTSGEKIKPSSNATTSAAHTGTSTGTDVLSTVNAPTVTFTSSQPSKAGDVGESPTYKPYPFETFHKVEEYGGESFTETIQEMPRSKHPYAQV